MMNEISAQSRETLRSGKSLPGNTDSGMIKVEYDKYDEEDYEVFEGNIYDFLIKEINNLEQDYQEYINEGKS
ncbi:hypothetical protein MP477_07255 [Chryseobacterium sp. WG23]|uniref:hypothetical protein n=1 Tax=Chryseobacterium sp. WG23 TaxID=2926910 RepID=UPI00211EC4E5|nr:hypothetical protein [Chryseobacterium sp. WG23]MCQ9634751.1 hypothetical protein [Chryseobacterium sp. WG23]